MRFGLFGGGKNDDEDPEERRRRREEWLRDLGFSAPEIGEDEISRLIDLGVIGEREAMQAKAQRMVLPFIDLDRVNVDSTALETVPAAIARQYQVLPVKKEGLNLWLAMADPKDIGAIDAVKNASQCRVFPVLAVPAAVIEAIEKYY